MLVRGATAGEIEAVAPEVERIVKGRGREAPPGKGEGIRSRAKSK